jgi:glycosyltransferase involved in cell wall biosynthesis
MRSSQSDIRKPNSYLEHHTTWQFNRCPNWTTDVITSLANIMDKPTGNRPRNENNLPQRRSTTFSIAIPTLNEERLIQKVLGCLANQTYRGFEIIVVDGGDRGPSTDRTVNVARSMGARVISLNRGGVADARNLGASVSLGDVIVFTEADARPPPDWLTIILNQFDESTVAVAGPGIPYDGTRLVMLEYAFYNALRYVVSRLPHPFKHLSASAYNVAIRRDVFEQIGGFSYYPANDDGLLGRRAAMVGKAKFCPTAYVWISARRFKGMGIIRANLHYLYVLENFLNFLAPVLRPLREKSGITFSKREGIKTKTRPTEELTKS